MNCHLATAINVIRSLSGCAAAQRAQAQGWQLTGKPASLAYAHDFGREMDDTHTSGEGPG
jgi:hypothetical protein